MARAANQKKKLPVIAGFLLRSSDEEHPISTTQLLEELGYQAGRIAVERNGEIVPKAQYGAVTLEDGDTLEVVRFVGGG